MKLLLILALYLIAMPSFSKNLGKVGSVWEIREDNLINVIKKNLEDKDSDYFRKQIMKNVQQNIERPTGIEIIRASKDDTRLFDPSIIVQQDLTDNNGKIFAHKGDKVNPFDTVKSFNRTLIFLNADDELQVNWFKSFRDKNHLDDKSKLILIKGNIRDAFNTFNQKIYFDQKGILINKFGIKAVPTVIDQSPENNRMLRIREFAIK
ncbi:TPA: hypothetical protein RNY16_002204 [Pasteurella multocida]|nr:hypothetical protein [Pasteurella multocida]